MVIQKPIEKEESETHKEHQTFHGQKIITYCQKHQEFSRVIFV